MSEMVDLNGYYTSQRSLGSVLSAFYAHKEKGLASYQQDTHPIWVFLISKDSVKQQWYGVLR